MGLETTVAAQCLSSGENPSNDAPVRQAWASEGVEVFSTEALKIKHSRFRDTHPSKRRAPTAEKEI